MDKIVYTILVGVLSVGIWAGALQWQVAGNTKATINCAEAREHMTADIVETKVQLARDYVTRSEVVNALERLERKIDTIQSDLKGKADK